MDSLEKQIFQIFIVTLLPKWKNSFFVQLEISRVKKIPSQLLWPHIVLWTQSRSHSNWDGTHAASVVTCRKVRVPIFHLLKSSETSNILQSSANACMTVPLYDCPPDTLPDPSVFMWKIWSQKAVKLFSYYKIRID